MDPFANLTVTNAFDSGGGALVQIAAESKPRINRDSADDTNRSCYALSLTFHSSDCIDSKVFLALQLPCSPALTTVQLAISSASAFK